MSQTTVQEIVLETAKPTNTLKKNSELNGSASNGGDQQPQETQQHLIDVNTYINNILSTLKAASNYAKDHSYKAYNTSYKAVEKSLNFLKDNKPLIKHYAIKTVSIILAMSVFFSFIVAYRVGKTFYSLEDTYVCRGLSWLDSSLGTSFETTFCLPFHEDVFIEASQEANKLVHEISNGFSQFANDIWKGFTVMYHLTIAILAQLYSSIAAGLSELWENMTENLGYLGDFIIKVFDFTYDLISTAVELLLCSFYVAVHYFKNLFVKQEESSWF